ncbi:endonuclease/exonuclease/phosphatase family protein [Streptomyces sp. NPDC001840]
MRRFAPAAVSLRIGTYNVLDGGRDEGGLYVRWAAQTSMLDQLSLDVLCIQGANHWDRNGSARAKGTAKTLGMTARLARSRSGGHLVILAREPKVRITRFYPDIVENRYQQKPFHHTVSRADLQIEGVEWPVRLLHAHLSPISPEDRAREAAWLTEYGDQPDTVLIGDLSCEAPDDPQPKSWDWLAPNLHSHHRIQHADGTYGDGDRRAMQALVDAGFQDPAALPGIERHRTVGYWDPTQLHDRRSDYILPTCRLLSTRAELRSYDVVDIETTRQLSSHLPVVAKLAVRRTLPLAARRRLQRYPA